MDGSNYVLNINVGGTKYTTYLSVVKKYPESHLSQMFPEDTSLWRRDDDGNVFIDRDGHAFRYILNYLRDGDVILPYRFAEFDLLLKEADFYGLVNLKTEIRKLMSVRKHVVIITEGTGTFHKTAYSSKVALVVEGTRNISEELKDHFKGGFYGSEEKCRSGLTKSFFNVNFRGSISVFLLRRGFKQEMSSPLTFAIDI
ncbi:BTB/POZ domain-containing protein KCTD6 [Apostichopus japonicus]|uniref:BTB/POZ domain-containing protein KCTD6 n=1 Tax=Stichopus japonicus TaxID=307972 RepID=A0A2G8JTL4_STIJA|nr:BTB/POZ domain-containing protein KCTD6 [Apostichopus japonicus]